MNQLIDNVAACSLAKYEQCKFNNNLKVLIISGSPSEKELSEAWQKIVLQFIDTAGVEVPELDTWKEVHNLTTKRLVLDRLFYIQEVQLDVFGTPHFEGLKDLAVFGIKPVWRDDVADFAKQLTKAKERSRSIDLRLSEAEDSLNNIRIASGKEKVNSENRLDHRKLLIEVQKEGYKIDEEKTSVEDFALILRAMFEKISKAQKN